MSYKKVGINWSGIRDLESLKFMISGNHVDFIEILIDNFLSCEVLSFLDVIQNTPCAFHIMNSRFLDNDKNNLITMSKSINLLRKELNPIYISDHLGKFYYKNFTLPQMLEIDYLSDKNKALEKLNIWQDLLDCQLLLENYPSIFPQEVGQSEFFSELIEKTNCGLLFDISNAIIAESNTEYAISHWNGLVKNTNHFHIAGYASCGIEDVFLVDTHDCQISAVGFNYTEYFLKNIQEDGVTISVERDSNFNHIEWLSDIEKIRNIINGN